MVGTILILLFLVHPSITATVFRKFNCIYIGNRWRLVEDTNQVCWEGNFIKWMLLGVFGLIFWVIGFPIIVLISMKE